MKKAFLLLIALAIITNFANAQWQQTGLNNIGGSISALITSGDTIFAGGVGMYWSTDNGNTWDTITNGLPANSLIYALVKKADTIFAGCDSSIYISSDNGNNWILASTGLGSALVVALAIKGDTVFAGTSGDGVYWTINSGQLWTNANNGLTSYHIGTIIVNGSNIFAGTGDGVFISSNNGQMWATTGFPDSIPVYVLSTDGDNIFAGTIGHGVYLSSDNGITWTSAGITNGVVTALTANDNFVFAGTQGYQPGGVFFSTDNGNNWTGTGLESLNIWLLAENDSFIFAGTEPYELWKLPLNVITGVENTNEYENNISVYPNPTFDNISFTLPQSGIIEIMAITGQMIKSMYSYSETITIDLKDFSSGVYIVRVRTDKQILIKKIIKE
jgi:photosystem II stability/assembly factor-like uncharacterized protein